MSLKKFACLLMATLALSACNVKMKGPDDAAPAQEKVVVGPDISGKWVSDCVPTLGGGKRFDVIFSENKITRRNITFKDDQCNYMVKDSVENGTFRYTEALANGVYTIEYKIPIGNGWSSLPKENVTLDGDVLYISDYDTTRIAKAALIPLKRKP